MYFSPYTNDCFQNAFGSIVSYINLNPDLILADYLSFIYSPETGYLGLNYLQKESGSVEFTEEELNTSLGYVYFPATTNFSMREAQKTKNIENDQIKITWYVDDDKDIAYSRMKELIDNEIPVVVVVDLFYMRYHKAYQKEHGMHSVIVTGYNEEENYVEIFDKYRFSNCDFNGRFPIDELMLARGSEYHSNTFCRAIRNLWMEFSNYKQFYYSEKRWKEIIEESCRRMYGEKDILRCKSGLGSIDAFRKDLIAKKAEKADPSLMGFFRHYYSGVFRSLSRSRNRFSAFLIAVGSEIPEALVTEVTSILKEAAKEWEICANLSIRLSIVKDMNIIDKLNEQLLSIRNYEKMAVDKLHKYINAK